MPSSRRLIMRAEAMTTAIARMWMVCTVGTTQPALAIAWLKAVASSQLQKSLSKRPMRLFAVLDGRRGKPGYTLHWPTPLPVRVGRLWSAAPLHSPIRGLFQVDLAPPRSDLEPAHRCACNGRRGGGLHRAQPCQPAARHAFRSGRRRGAAPHLRLARRLRALEHGERTYSRCRTVPNPNALRAIRRPAARGAHRGGGLRRGARLRSCRISPDHPGAASVLFRRGRAQADRRRAGRERRTVVREPRAVRIRAQGAPALRSVRPVTGSVVADTLHNLMV